MAQATALCRYLEIHDPLLFGEFIDALADEARSGRPRSGADWKALHENALMRSYGIGIESSSVTGTRFCARTVLT